MKNGSCGLVPRIGAADSATPHPDPCGGQAPALHFLIPPSAIGLQFGRIRPWRAGIEVDWRAHPGSESGTCFRTNRPCRLSPAHQGMKSWSCGLVRRIGTADSATPLLRPSGGQAPALHFLEGSDDSTIWSTTRQDLPSRAGESKYRSVWIARAVALTGTGLAVKT